MAETIKTTLYGTPATIHLYPYVPPDMRGVLDVLVRSLEKKGR